MNQTDGMLIPRWGSLARSAPPVSLNDGAITQSFEPTWWSPTSPPPASRPAMARIRWPIVATSRQPASLVSVAVAVRGAGDDAVVAAGKRVAASDGVITGIESPYGGNSASVSVGSPSF